MNNEFEFRREPEVIDEILSRTKDIDYDDLKIISLLQDDGRASLNTIASKLGMSTATISRRVKKLEEKGVIKDYSAIVSCDKLGFAEHLLIMIELIPGTDVDKVGSYIADIPNINCVYAVLSDFDLLVHLRCATSRETSATIQQIGMIEGVAKLRKMSVYSRIKEDFRVII